jgi:pimeloyl-ACP methyl ester carboxylesterase
MTPEQLALMAGNRASLAVYAGQNSMADATLGARLRGITIPTLVVWGEADRIADPVYGRAFADAIPGAEFLLLAETGHLPQLETPDRLLAPVRDFAAAQR